MPDPAPNGAKRTLDALTPEELALDARSGKEQAARSFEELVARFEGSLFQFLYLRVGSREVAEEIAQETFLRAWHKLSLYDPSRPFATWLFTLAKNLAVSHARRRSTSEETQSSGHWRSMGGTMEDVRGPSVAAEEREEGIRLWRLASRVLKVEQRSALWLRYAEDLSIEEIARILGRPTVTVRVLLHRARAALAEHLVAFETPDEGPGRKPERRFSGSGDDRTAFLAQNGVGRR